MHPYFHVLDRPREKTPLRAEPGTVQVFRPKKGSAGVFPRDFTPAFTHPEASLNAAARTKHGGRAGESGDVFLLGGTTYRHGGELSAR